MQSDLISVVISVLNGGATLAACLESIVVQDYISVEIIVIDGGSTDDSIAIIERYSKFIYYFVSEPDTGIYCAWNKALRVVRGNWVCFIGSDDIFAAEDSLSRLADIAIFPDVNYASGRVALVNSKGELQRLVGEKFLFRGLRLGMKFAHPGSLHHIGLFKSYGGFNENFKISGDYEFFLRCGDSIRASFTSATLVLMRNNGVSHRMVYKGMFENYRALRDVPNYGRFDATKMLLISLGKFVARRLTPRFIMRK